VLSIPAVAGLYPILGRAVVKKGFRRSAFTLLELVIVLLIMTVVASSSLLLVQNKDEQIRYESTKNKLQEIKYAILGDTGYPIRPFFLKDMGRLPDNLQELVTIGNLAPWDDTRKRGWRGPYLNGRMDSDGSVRFRDGWMNDDNSENFGWKVTLEESSAPNEDTNSSNQWLKVQSYGSDGTSGGSEYAIDYPADTSFLVSKYEFNKEFDRQFEITRDRIAEIKSAVTGANSTLISNCYYADLGRFPTSVNELLTTGSQPKWSDNVESGWRGPYLKILPCKDGTYRYRDGFNNPWDPSKTEIDNTNNRQKLADDENNWGWIFKLEETEDSAADLDTENDWLHVQSILEYGAVAADNTRYPLDSDYTIIKTRDLPLPTTLQSAVVLTIQVNFPADFAGDVRVAIYNSVIGNHSMPISAENHTFISAIKSISANSPETEFVITLPGGVQVKPLKNYIVILDATSEPTGTVRENIITEYSGGNELNYPYAAKNITIETKTINIDLN